MTRNRFADVRLLWGGLLIVLGAVLLVQTTGVIPDWASIWYGTGILAAIGLAFLAVYLTTPARWWALIPAGTLLTLAIVAGVTPFVPSAVGGAIFLLGLGATFGAVALAPPALPQRAWAWIPAGVLGLLGVITLGSTEAAALFWPLVLILGGVLLVAWSVRGRQPRS